MKRILCVLIATLCLCACWAGNSKKAIVWEQPVAKANQVFNEPYRSQLNIYRVEFADDETRVFMHITYHPNYWIMFVKETYLLADGKKYLVKSSDGLKLDEKHYMPSSGKEDVVFHFAPLPKKTQEFDFLEGDGEQNFKIRGVESINTRIKRLFSSLWRNDATGDWEIGFYDDFAIYDCRYWQYKQKTQKGDKYSLILTDGKSDLAVNIDKPQQGKRMMSINGKKAEYSLITTFTLPNYPQKDETTRLKDTHYKPDTAVVVGWLRNMPKELWEASQEYSVNYLDLFIRNKDITNYCKLDSLGRFAIKVPVINSTEVYMDWKHTYIQTILEPGETYYLLYDFKDGHAMFMGKNCRLQNELLAHPIPWLNSDYEGKFHNKITTQEMFQIMEPRYTEVKEKLQKQIEENPSLSQRYQEYAKGSLLCSYAETLMQGSYFVKDYDFPKEYMTKMENLWREIPKPYTQYQDYTIFMKDFLRQEIIQKYSTPMGKYWSFIYSKYYPELLRKHQAFGDIMITDPEIATIEQWGKKIESLSIQMQNMELEKDREKMHQAFQTTALAKRAKAIIERKDIDQMLKEDASLINVYFAQHIADSLGCDQEQKDILVAHSLMSQLENNYVPFSAYGVYLTNQSINSEFIKKRVLAENQRFIDLQNWDISKSTSMKTAPQDISDGEKLLRKITEPYRGKIILIDIWGTWCGPCMEALTHSKDEFARLAPYDVAYLYLASNSPEDKWKNTIKDHHLIGDNIAHYNLPAAQQSAIENYLKVHSYPSYRIIDKNGNLVDVKVDARQLDKLEKIIKELSK